MTGTDQVKRIIDSINGRQYDAMRDVLAPGLKFHAPGLGIDVEGAEAAVGSVRDFVEQADIRYEVQDIVERGPFAVAFLRSMGRLDGRQMTWDLCQVCRLEGGSVSEIWALRGSDPRPVEGS